MFAGTSTDFLLRKTTYHVIQAWWLAGRTVVMVEEEVPRPS